MTWLSVGVVLGISMGDPVWSLDNGLGLKPPLGWRSWNLYGANVNQDLMMKVMDGMVSRKRKVDGVPTSLCDLGYCDVGLDDNWQKCGNYGVNKYTMHTDSGVPIVDNETFPDMLAMTDYAHSLGLTAGWYLNNCICEDHCGIGSDVYEIDTKCYKGDAAALQLFGFDGVKLDNCGKQKDLDLWSRLFNESGKAIMIENCHWGESVPTKDHCPYNFYRTSGDVRAKYLSVIQNLDTVQKFADQNLSTPGCWAYPDMLEVGCKHGPGGADDPGLSHDEAKTHFAGWCIVSSPLTLSHDVNDDSIMDEVWPIISNKHALRVNQEYAGFSGGKFFESTAHVYIGLDRLPKAQYYYKPLLNGDIALLLINNDQDDAKMVLDMSTVPGISIGYQYKVLDVWQQATIQQVHASGSTTTDSIPSHGSVFWILSRA